MTIEQVSQALLFDSNMFIIIGDQKVALIDAGTGFQSDANIESIDRILGGRALDLVFLTHRHFDHVGGLSRIIDRYHPIVYAGEGDAEPLIDGDSESTMGTAFGGTIPRMDVIPVKDGDEFDLGGHNLRVISTPGHTIGSICLLDTVTDALFSGDTFFVDGVGRTDLPTGSLSDLKASLLSLRNIKFNGLFSGHGPVVMSGGTKFLEKGINQLGL